MKEKKFSPIWYILFGIFLIISYQIILPIIYSKFISPLFPKTNLWNNVANILYYFIIVIILILIYHKSLKEEGTLFLKNRKEFTRIAWHSWGKGILLMILSNILVLSITGNISGNEEYNREVLTNMPIYAITVMCLFGPFIEEMVFRKSFRKAFQNKYVFAFFTSLLFAALHVLNSFDALTMEVLLANWKQMFFLIPYSSLAFFFALSYYDTKSIFTSTIAHMFHNTLTVMLILATSIL